MITLADVESAVAKLAALGSTADEVATALVATGIKARRSCAHSCIIAEWMIAKSGLEDIQEIEVDGPFDSPRWHVSVWRGLHEGGRVHLPVHLGELAKRFDEGAWPALVVAS